MTHLYLKAFHIIGFVSWFAGLFYLVRIFVYHTEADAVQEPIKSDRHQLFSLMQSRVYSIICTPAMCITWACGLAMLFNTPAFLEQPWMQLKLVFLVLLTAYHFYCSTIIKRLKRGERPFNSFQFRLLNEFPTLFLIAIVLLAVVKNILNFGYLLLGVLLFGVTLGFAARVYKNYRMRKNS